MIDLPFEISWFIYLAFASLVLAVLTLLFLILNRVRRTVKRYRREYIRYIGVSQNLFRFVATILWIAISAAILFLAAFIQSYQNFTKQELAAEVLCVPVSGNDETMLLELTELKDGRKQAPQKFILHGDQWAVEGNILKWDDWLNFAGIHTMYKLTRVRGRYESYQEEISRQPTVYSLVEYEDDPRWRWLFQYGHKLRFVDAVYGNTVFTYPSENKTYEIYVTTSGFIARVKGE